ncbi:MAG: ABC transporter substrate-binding protein [Deltaproteobacteria bacterium]|nr:ABC transporter substrate-binding protein [Deltaproteobacteria bacterium]
MEISARRFIKCSASILIVFFSLFAGIAGGSTAKLRRGIPLHLRYAHHFHIEYLGNGCKRVTDGAGRKLLLVPRGQKVAVTLHDSMVIRIPVKRVVTKWTTIPPLLKVLGVMGSVAGVTTRKRQWHIDEIRKGMEEGRIKYLGESRATDYERLRAINPDIFFAGEWEKTEKLNELGIPFAVVTEYLEKDPLGRLEWIKFFAAFYNREHEAEKFFEKAVENVDTLSKKLERVGNRPNILWGFIRGRGTVYVPRAGSYVAKMISVAEGRYVFGELRQTGSAAITLEEFYAQGKNADIYISPATLPRYGITSTRKLVALYPILSDFRSVKRGNIWCFQPWYWESIDKTDGIIEDLAAIFHPRLFPGHRPGYFLKLPER